MRVRLSRNVTVSARLPWFIAIPFMVLWLAVVAVAAVFIAVARLLRGVWLPGAAGAYAIGARHAS